MVPSWPSFEGATLKSFDEIALAAGTDKASNIHGYCQKYERYLPFDRQKPLTLLEIGVLSGASILAWSEFYPNARVVGVDINPDCAQFHDEDRNITIEIGSQADGAFLQHVAEQYGPFDLIVDDGSHLQNHVIFSFECLWPWVKAGGVYVVEDSVTSYWPDYGGGLRAPGSMVEYFKAIVDDVNFNGEKQTTLSPPHSRRDDGLIRQFGNRPCYGKTMESIQFLNSIIMMRKRG